MVIDEDMGNFGFVLYNIYDFVSNLFVDILFFINFVIGLFKINREIKYGRI